MRKPALDCWSGPARPVGRGGLSFGPSTASDRTLWTVLSIVRLIADRWKRGDLAELVHPEAEVESVAAPGRKLRGREEYLEVIRGTLDTVWLQRVESVEPLGEDRALTVATIRYPLDGGGHGLGRYVWLDEVRDGMLWRVRIFSTSEEARAAALEHGG